MPRGPGFRFGALDLTIQLGSGLGQLDQQGWRLVPSDGQLSSGGEQSQLATASGQCDQGAPSDCASSVVLSQTQISQESSRDLTLGQTALVCGAAELTVCNSTGDLAESFCSASGAADSMQQAVGISRQQVAGNSGQQTAGIGEQQDFLKPPRRKR